MYLKGFNHLGTENLGVFILCKSSWNQPKGHKNPQIHRPKIRPITPITPTTYTEYQYLALPRTACNAPIGQEVTAPGQE